MPLKENCLFHGLPAVRLQADDGCTATVTLHGAHVVSWTSAAGVEQLYLSPLTNFAAGQALRGGVPLVFPQFNTRGPLPRHGFARTANWTEVEARQPVGACSVTLALPATPATSSITALWPHRFDCRLTVSLQQDSLSMELTVHNQGADSFHFQAALHTYLAIGDIASVTLSGLDGSDYEDTTPAGRNAILRHSAPVAGDPTDRIYYNAPQQVQVQCQRGHMQLQQRGFTDLVVWNPGDLESGFPPDLPRDGFKNFLCVEAAQIGQPVLLAPQQLWSGMQTIQAAR